MSFKLRCPIFQGPLFEYIFDIEEPKSKWDAPAKKFYSEIYWVLELFEEYNIVENEDEDEHDDQKHLIDGFEFYKSTPIKSSNGENFSSISMADEKNKYNCEDIWYTLKDNISNQTIYFYGNKNKNAITIKEGLSLNARPVENVKPGVYNYKIVMNKIIEIIYEINKHKPNFRLYVDKKAITGVYDDDNSEYNLKLREKWKNETKKMWERKSELGTFKHQAKHRNKKAKHRNKKADILEWVPDENYNPDDFNPEILNNTTKLTLTRKNLHPLADVITSYIGPLKPKAHFEGGKRKTKKYINSRKTRKINTRASKNKK
jgi:hypothetical protein